MNGNELDMKDGVCPKCSADDVRVQPRFQRRLGYHNFLAISWWGGSVRIVNYVCVTCGYLESYIDRADLDTVARKWERVEQSETV